MNGQRVGRWRPGEPVAPLADLVRRGGVIALPTESSYGLGVDPTDADAVARVFEIKGRPPGEPLPLVVADFDQIRSLGGVATPQEERWLRSVWPAPLTVLLPTLRDLPAAAGSARLGFRIPELLELRELLVELGTGLTATSANRSGEPPIVDPAGLEGLLQGHDAVIVDSGVLPGGRPSTLVAWRDGEFEVLREGRFAVKGLTSFSSPSVEISVEDAG